MTGITEPTDDAVTNASGNPSFAAMIGRRRIIQGGLAGAAAFLAGGHTMAGNAIAEAINGSSDGSPLLLLGFEAIAPGTADTVAVPPGYTARAILPWGDPIVPSGPAFSDDASNSAADQREQIGMGHDGIHYFPLDGSNTGLIAMNHEYTVGAQLFPDGREEWTAEKTAKEQAAHGVTVVEVEAAGGAWNTVESPRARRIDANTPMRFSGPAAGHRLVRTSADPTGSVPLGTLNNCGNGYTPWGTYLTTEENFNGYFHEETDGAGLSAEQVEINERYGIAGTGFGYLWATTDDRFRADVNPQEPNRFGWIVEIDPYDPTSTPVKHTALGRFKHEGAAFATGADGQAVVYMGDDQRDDYVYKFVSDGDWLADRKAGRNPLESGTLYAARFDDESSGTWLPLVHGVGPLVAANGFADQGDVVVKTRLAADAVGATTMDRPEWTAVHPSTGEVFVTCTNNTARTEANVANPRLANSWGHIIRWTEDGGDPAAETFSWDFFLLAGPADGESGSTLDADDEMGSPDGLWVDANCRMWIQTDGAQPGEGNNQMFCADPATGEIRRFLVGPPNCEVTGVTATPDGKTLFINIQHPGDRGPAEDPTATSTWPDGPGAGRPRPATVAITKDDGGVIGT